MIEDDVPSAGEAYARAWDRLWLTFPELLPVALVWSAIAAPNVVLHVVHSPLAFFYEVLVTVPLSFGAYYAYVRAARGEPVEVTHLFHAFRTCYVQCIVVHFIFIVLVGIGFAFLVVPGIYLVTRLTFVAFLVVDEGYDGTEAVAESWRRTGPYAGRIFVMWMLAIPIAVAGLLCLGVGIVPAVMWINLAFATVFVGVTEGFDAGTRAVSATGSPAPVG